MSVEGVLDGISLGDEGKEVGGFVKELGVWLGDKVSSTCEGNRVGVKDGSFDGGSEGVCVKPVGWRVGVAEGHWLGWAHLSPS